MQVPEFQYCPRCLEQGFERLSGHAYCTLCNYSSETSNEASYDAIPEWVVDILNADNAECDDESADDALEQEVA